MGFKVDTRADLDEWLAQFEQLGVSHSPIAEREYGAVLTFKDPDGIQVELIRQPLMEVPESAPQED